VTDGPRPAAGTRVTEPAAGIPATRPAARLTSPLGRATAPPRQATSPPPKATSPLRQAARSLAIRLSLVVLGGATGIVIARALHPQGRGTYAIVVAFASATMAIGHLSLDQAHVTLWPSRHGAVAVNSVVMGPVLGTLAAACGLALALSGVAGAATAAHPGLLIVALLSVPAATTVLYLSNVLALGARVAWVDWATLLGSVLQCGALLALAAAGRLTVAWVVWIWAASSAAPLLLMVGAARPRLGRFDPAVCRRALSLGLRYHGGSAALYLTYRVDVLVLGAMAPAAVVGLYTLAVTLAELARIPTDALARASLSGQAVADLNQAARATIRRTRMSVALAGGSVAGLCAVAPLLVPVAYGRDFAGSVPALFALAPGLFALGAGRQVSAYLLRLSRPLAMSALSVGALVVNVAANLVLIPLWGIVGCSLASSLSYGLITAVQVARFCRATDTPLRRLLPAGPELAALRRRLCRSARPIRPSTADPVEHVLVAAQAPAAGGEVTQREAAVADVREDLLGAGHLERVPADPIDEIVPARHATGPGRLGGRPDAAAQQPYRRAHRYAPAKVQKAQPDQQQPADPA
jgi:O-antigen/teichoic acid export membrane protein